MRDNVTGRRETARSGRGSLVLVTLLIILLIAAASAFLFLPERPAGLVVLGCLGLLSTAGVVALFTGAAGILRVADASELPMGGGAEAEAFLENMAEGVLMTQADGAPRWANPAFVKLSGAENERDLHSIERLFSDNPDASEAVYRLAVAAEAGRRATEEIRMPGGIGGRANGARWYRVRVSPVGRPAAGSMSASIGWLIADITREREHQENIFQELQNAIDYLDHAPAGFFSLEPDGRIRYLNATLAEWIGIDLAEFEPGAAHIRDIVSVDGLSVIQASSPGRAEAEILDIDLVRTDGTRLPVRLLHRVPTAADGTIGASRTLVLDMRLGDDREAGRIAELRFARFFSNTPMAIAAIDRQGRIGLTNARFVMLFGRRSGDARLRPADLVAASDRASLAAAMDAAIAGQSNIPAVDAALAEDPERSARFFVSPILEGDEGEDAAIIYALDMTEQRALEAQFAQSQKMQAVGQLAGGIAHDFNNVLTAIIGFSDLLLTNHRPTDPSFQDIMNIKQNANRAAGLVRQLLAFSRRQTLRPRIIELDEVLSDLKILLDRLLGEMVTLEVEHGRDLWPVKADINQLEQVIVNLAVNARDAMPAGGRLTIRTANVPTPESLKFREQGFKPGDYVLVEVADTGAGMAPEIMGKIFEPFFSTKEVGKGTGLGLSTVYGIVKQTGGYVYVESKPGEGSTFRILLPRHAAAPEDKVEEVKPVAVSADLTGSARILLVEDEEAVRAFAGRALTARGYTVIEAASGPEALELMNGMGEEIDLVISDVVMPGMDGPTLLRELRRRQPKLKIIFMSGYAEDAFERHLPEDQTFNFLPKPFSLKELATTVKATLDS
ncbi:MAG: response regulator [Rhizobiales bacterium]|nr:response regulator [Hyphomicrobiales bacterium]